MSSYIEQSETAVVKYSPPHHATGCNLEKRLSNIDPITIKETEVKAQCSKSIIVRPSLDLEGKGTKTSETVKVQRLQVSLFRLNL